MDAGQIALVAVSIIALVVVGGAVGFCFYLAEQLSDARGDEKKLIQEAGELKLHASELLRSIDDRDKALGTLTQDLDAEKRARATCQKQYDDLIETVARTGNTKDVVSSINEELQKLAKSSAEPEKKPTPDKKSSP